MPEGWSWARLNQIFNFIDYRGSTPTKISSGVPLITAKNVKSGYIDYTVDDYISEDEYADRQQRGISCYGDILFTTEAPLGNAAIADLDKFSAGQRLITFQHYGNQKLNNTNFLYFLLSDFFQNQLNANKTGSTVAGIKAAILKGLFLPVPPIEEQQRIAASCKNMFNMIEIVKNEQEDISKLISITKSKILDLAIRGKLVPQDPNDEPASVLLDRIQSEKEELIKAGKIKRDKKESVIFKGEDNSYYQKVEADGSVVIQRVDVPPTWAVCCLQEISYPVSTVGMQIKSEEIQKDGVFPVISQGQSFIDGYYSDESKVIYDSPIILFGDHTRNVKYIDFPFVVGADGTKLHKVIRANERYVYYWMCHASQCIADRGYARHYSLLQKECFTLPPIAEQIRIVNCIDQLFSQLDSIADALL